MYEKMTASYCEANARANGTNEGKVFEYTILDKDFREVETGLCINVQHRYDTCYDFNWVSFTDINTHKTRRICQFYVQMRER